MNLHPDAAFDDLGLAPPAANGTEHTNTCWNAMLSEAQKVLQLTLEELAVLAGLSTAAIEMPAGSHMDAASRSAYSLLLEPDLFRFPS